MQLAPPLGLKTSCAIGRHVVGEDGIGKHRNMAENIMEDVGLLEIVQLACRTNETARRKSAISQVLEKDFVGNQAVHRHHAPARERLEFLIQAFKVWNSAPNEVERL